MNMNDGLIKGFSILLIFLLIFEIFINVFLVNEVEAAVKQTTEEYKKGDTDGILDGYPGYSELLDALLEAHPDWTFTILFTGLDWDEVIENETTGYHSRSLVQNSSTDWICSTCGSKTYDNGTWYCASTAAVEYYMDPRNWLFEEYVFQFENLEWKDNTYTQEGVEKIIAGTFLDVEEIEYTTTEGKTATINKSYAQVIMEAAEKAGISPYHLASRIVQEQGSGGSSTSSGTYSGYTGYYNFLNINATGSDIIGNALSYAKNENRNWTDPEKSIVGGAEFLASSYISIGQSTLYLQKFDVDNSDGSLYSHQYMQNVSAAMTEGKSIKSAYAKIDSSLNISFNFVIPVYENMPSSNCAVPGTDGGELVEVVCSSLIVRKEPTRSSSQIGSAWNGEILTRIESGVATADGYTWDKVVTDLGIVGYVARGSSTETYIESLGITSGKSIFEIDDDESEIVCVPSTTVSDITDKLTGVTIKNSSGKTVTSGNIGTGYTIEYNGTTYTVVKLRRCQWRRNNKCIRLCEYKELYYGF